MRLVFLLALIPCASLCACGNSSTQFTPTDTAGGPGSGTVVTGSGTSTGATGSTGTSSGTSRAPGPSSLSGPLTFNVVYAGGQATYAATSDGNGYTQLNLWLNDLASSTCGYTGAATSPGGGNNDLEVALSAQPVPGTFIYPGEQFDIPNDSVDGIAQASLGVLQADRGVVDLYTFSAPTDGGPFLEATGHMDLSFALPDGGTSELVGDFDVGNCP